MARSLWKENDINISQQRERKGELVTFLIELIINPAVSDVSSVENVTRVAVSRKLNFTFCGTLYLQWGGML
jgi:hypothetical protein